ncbi:MAG: SEC-C metal-binding domain-containing protein [Phycisphaerae bacterium]
MLKMLDKHAFETQGMALEMKQLTKGIEKAQRKVEERNFSTRKNLLEWDEPMDYQRKAFYDARQDVLEGRGLRDRILDMIDQAIDETVGRFLAGNYNAQCIVDWCREELSLQVEEAEFVNLIDPAQVQAAIRSSGIDDARETIRRSIGEYIDPDAPADTWDIGGLQSWAQRAYKVAVSKNQLRKMEADDITELLIEAAEGYFENVNLEGVVRFADPDYPLTALTHWARNQFNLDLDAKDFVDVPTEDVAGKVHDQVRDAYHEREISYPVDYTLARTAAAAGQNAAMLAEYVLGWANAKFNVGWKLEDLEGRQLSDVREQLVALSGEFMDGGRLEAEVDAALEAHEGDALKNWAAARFGPAWREDRFDASAEDPRDLLVEMGREMLRWELSLLEHRVILQLYDQAWKDHLLEMDRLELAIKQRPLGGDQTHPQSQFAIEGRDLFNQMWERLRERIVGVILKVHAAPPGQGESAPTDRAMTLSHSDATGAAFAGAAADQTAAMRAQGSQEKVETIRRETPKVGRNDPCPCGSGKKYKQCCGRKGAAAAK